MANPWDKDEVLDTTYGGVEQAMPTKADFQLASNKRPTDRVIALNGGDTRSAHQILEDYQGPHDDPASLSVGPVGQTIQKAWDATPWKQDDIAPWHSDDVIAKPWEHDQEVKSPDTIPFLADKLASGVHAAAKNLAVMGDAAANLMYPGIETNFTDKLPGPDAPLVPPEQAANASFGQKLLGGVVEAAPNILEAVATGNPLAAAGVLGGNAAISTGTGLLDQGASLGRAQTAATVSGAINAVGAAPILKAQSLVSSALWGGATNPVIGAMDDIAQKRILEGSEQAQDQKIAASINPWDWEKRAVEAGVGIGMGTAFHVAGLPAQYRKNKLLNELYDAMKDKEKFSQWTQDQIKTLDSIVSPLVGDRTHTTPESLGVKDHNEALRKLLEPQEFDEANMTHAEALAERAKTEPSKVMDVLDILATHPDISEEHRNYAQVLQRLAADVGLDTSHIFGTTDPDHPAGRFDGSSDVTSIQVKHTENARVILHELTHAVFQHAINLRIAQKSGQATLSDRQTEIADRVAPIEAIFERAKEIAFKNPELKAAFDRAEAHHAMVSIGVMKPNDPARVRHTSETYGFKNLHEFVSEAMTTPKFQEQLQRMRAIDSEGNALPIAKASGGKIKTMWQALKTSLKNVLNPGATVSTGERTLFDAAFDHITNLGSNLTAADRSLNERSQGRTGDRAWLREDAKAKLADANQAYTMGRISQLLQDSASKGEFLTRLNVEMSSPQWKEFVAKRGDALWEQGEHVIRTVGHSDVQFKDLPEATKRLTADPRTVEEFFKDEFGEVMNPLKKGDDISPAGTAFLPATNIKLEKAPNTIAGKLISFVIDKGRMYTSLGAKMHAEAAQYYNEFHKLGRKAQENLMNEALYWDDAQAGRKQLIQLGMQWPTKEMLVHRGLTEAEAHAYGEVTKGLDFLHSLLQQALIKSGQPPLDRIPGYLPHVFKGAYKVLVRGKELATGKEFVVEVKGYNTKLGALNYLKALEKGAKDVQGWQFSAEPDPQTGKGYRVQKIQEVSESLMTSLQDHMTAYVNNSLLNPGIAEHLEKIDNASKRGFSKHIIERSDVAGYLGKRNLNEAAGLDRGLMAKIGLSRTNNQIRELYDNYAKNVTEYYKNVMFMAEVTQPILDKTPEPHENGSTYGALLDHVTELQDYIQKYTYNFTGEGLNHLMRFVDKPARAASIAIGISPTLYREAAGMLRNTFALLKLRANPGFYIGNALQWGHVMTMLEMVNAMRTQEGQKSPYVMASVLKALKEVTPGPELGAALEWARDNHVIDPQLEAEMRRMKPANQAMDLLSKVTGGPINPAIERFSREVSFRIAYMHMREIYPGDVIKARQAAAQLMKMTMVDYDRSSRPLMFQQTGVVGEMISPFQVYRNAYLGNLKQMLSLAAQGAKQGKPTMFLPMLTSIGTFFVLAGAVGMPLAAEYNMVMNQLQKLMPDQQDMFPTLQELLFKAHVPDWVTFGMLSSSTKGIEGLENGVYIGSSVNSVDTTQPVGTALFPFLDAIKDVSGVAGRAFMHELFPDQVFPVVAEDLYKASKQLAPGVASHYIEKLVRPEGSDVAPKAGTLEGSVRLEDADVMAQNLGKQSLKVTKDTTINRLIDQDQKANRDAVKRLVQSAADIQMGYGVQGTSDDAQRLAAKPPYEIPREEFYKMVADEVFSRSFPAREKDVKIKTRESFWKQQQRLDMEQ